MPKCSKCGHDNPSDALFCEECGSRLAAAPAGPPAPPTRCPQCGHDNPSDALFCEECGFKLPVPAAPPVVPAPPPAAPPPPAPLYNLEVKGNLIPVAEAVKTFGRADFISYVTENESKFISRKHFTISREADGFYIVDENSANGTKLNGVEIKGQGKKPLKNGDKILVADTLELVFVAGG